MHDFVAWIVGRFLVDEGAGLAWDGGRERVLANYIPEAPPWPMPMTKRSGRGVYDCCH
jgi:hypothetical protein